jgi:hypothetical protein
LLVQAGHFGTALDDRAHSLFGYTLLNEALTRGYQEIFIIISWIYILLGISVFFLRMPKNAG